MIERGPFLIPEWDAPRQVEAWFTTREGGVSAGPYASMNLGLHVGDTPEAVAENRRLALLAVEDKPVWLNQVHGNAVVRLDAHPAAAPVADAAVATRRGLVCTVLVADCLPVFLCDRDGAAVGVAHAGWRGLAAGVLEAAVRAFALPSERLIAYLGPAIGARAFEVGSDVRDAFMALDEGAHEAFHAIVDRPGKYWCDLNLLARRRLRAAGVYDISGGAHCTFSRPDRFFSYRRDGVTGRMGAFIRLRG
jgi:YfiH family protein